MAMKKEKVFYTLSERTEKKYTVEDAVELAKKVLWKNKIKANLTPVNKFKSLKEALTLEEVNVLMDDIISESQHYSQY